MLTYLKRLLSPTTIDMPLEIALIELNETELTAEQQQALSRARRVRGCAEPYGFHKDCFLYDCRPTPWQIVELNVQFPGIQQVSYVDNLLAPTRKILALLKLAPVKASVNLGTATRDDFNFPDENPLLSVHGRAEERKIYIFGQEPTIEQAITAAVRKPMGPGTFAYPEGGVMKYLELVLDDDTEMDIVDRAPEKALALAVIAKSAWPVWNHHRIAETVASRLRAPSRPDPGPAMAGCALN